MTEHFTKPRVLFVDIETIFMLLEGWDLYNQNFSIPQIHTDWSIIAWAASWEDSEEIIYYDTGDQENIRDDSKILEPLWDLMDQADIVIGQHSKKFDVKKIFARFIMNKTRGGKPPSSFRQEDTREMAKKVFGFTSNKLEYLGQALGVEDKKMVDRKFPGHLLWKECAAKNPEAWKEMRLYNPIDIKATKQVYAKLRAWAPTLNRNTYHKMHENICLCGSEEFTKNGFRHTNSGKFQRYTCVSCGKEFIDRANELSAKKKQEMFKP